jgi:putative membrane protein
VDRHRRVLLGSGAISALALSAVFAAALRVVPPRAIPRAPDAVVAAIPHLNAALNLLAFVAVAAGWRFARRREIRRHRAAMLAGAGLFGAFLALYLYRVALVGPTHFGGTGALALAYYATLAIHVLLAVIAVPLVIYVLTLVTAYPVAELSQTPHARIGRFAAPLWLLSFALGMVVYAALYLR